MKLRTCVAPDGRFVFGLHRPAYRVANLREHDFVAPLGRDAAGNIIFNASNFPAADLQVAESDWIYEIPNPFPFRGTTFICRSWAEKMAENPGRIGLPAPPPVSMTEWFAAFSTSPAEREKAFRSLPEPVLVTLASTSTDPRDLVLLAKISCDFLYAGEMEKPVGLLYSGRNGRPGPVIHRHDLYETVVNNPFLPDAYKEVMVLRPGVQGESEIVGEYGAGGTTTHVFEYLRRNSYIPWGHYAANMAHDAVRYRMEELGQQDMRGLRHLYYQRIYMRLAELLGIAQPCRRQAMTPDELERLRIAIVATLRDRLESTTLEFTATLWGWNFGFDFAGSGYRLHASHQQVHQQFALLPAAIPAWHSGGEPADRRLPAYGCGDLVGEFCREYRRETGKDFFGNYIEAIRNNRRMDEGRDANRSLVVYEDENVMLFVPKAQTSQWELQLVALAPVGNILEAGTSTRESFDRAMLIAQKILAALGARLVTSIEFSKRFDDEETDQRLLYAFLPKLPHAMGAFSEAQLRWINGHFPEDFAAACREKARQLNLAAIRSEGG